MAERITFYSDGLELVGYLHKPKGMRASEKRSAIVLCPGFGAHQERFLPEMASHLANSGFMALTFDYRGFGESEGPRWRMIPQEQVKDISSAITFLQLQDSVDGDQIGLHGISFGGANVCYVASVDRRVRCLVSIVGVGCGEKWLRGLRRTWEWKAFLKELQDDRKHRVVHGASRIVERLHIMLPRSGLRRDDPADPNQVPGYLHRDAFGDGGSRHQLPPTGGNEAGAARECAVYRGRGGRLGTRLQYKGAVPSGRRAQEMGGPRGLRTLPSIRITVFRDSDGGEHRLVHQIHPPGGELESRPLPTITRLASADSRPTRLP